MEGIKRLYGSCLWILILLLLVTTLAACGRQPKAAPDIQETEGIGEGEGAEKELRWDSPPGLTIDLDKVYIATLITEKGDVRVELFAQDAPITVNNFVFLAEQGYYDETTFHRVLPDFMAQGGDPTGTGTGGPGYQFEDEIVHGVTFNREGLLAMANSGPGTNGSQFFITFGAAPWLNGMHTIFGQVIEGMDVIHSLTMRDPAEAPDYPGDRLKRVEIEVAERSQLPTPTPMDDAVIPIPEEGRPLAEIPPEERERLFNGMPEMVIELDKEYVATIVTSKGTILAKLEPLSAPVSVNNFLVLANLGYWDGFPISNAQPEAFFVTGSPGSRPDSDVGYTLPSENGSAATRGAIGFWFRTDMLASSGSQIFITLDDLPGMEEFFTVFGYVTRGIEVADALTIEDHIVSITVDIE
ncbi:MAG: peptidylprolyl isomerase [Anaerolineales bacterium]